MLIPVKEISDGLTEEQERCCRDLLRNASSPAMSWGERGFRQKLIDTLYKVGYYKVNDSVYSLPKEK